jgi:hypothetical protein
LAHVDHHDLVAEAVHLHESVAGERAHVAVLIPDLIWPKIGATPAVRG